VKLYANLTSPYGRIARVALREKGLWPQVDEQIVDPWTDPPAFLAANPAARVPTLVLDDGRALTESLLIVQWLEATVPQPTLLGDDPATVLGQAGIAMGAIDAAVAVIINRKTVTTEYDALPVGVRRTRTMTEALKRLDAAPPAYAGGTPSLAVIAAVDLLDYLRFRFPGAAWMPATPGLDALAATLGDRASIVETRPR
jgi:glutathione S-transferase